VYYYSGTKGVNQHLKQGEVDIGLSPAYYGALGYGSALLLPGCGLNFSKPAHPDSPFGFEFLTQSTDF